MVRTDPDNRFLKKNSKWHETCINHCWENKTMRKHSGFTVVELLVVIALIGTIAAIAVPNFISWLPNYRLRSAADDLYSNFQIVKLGAIKNNNNWAIVFNEGADSYTLISDYGGTNTTEKTVVLSSYKSGVGFGNGNATQDIPVNGFPNGMVSYTSPNDTAVFNPQGLTTTLGYVYLSNDQGAARAVGTPFLAGAIVSREWRGASWQ